MFDWKILQILSFKQINSYGGANKSNLKEIKKISGVIKTNYTKKGLTDKSEILSSSLY